MESPATKAGDIEPGTADSGAGDGPATPPSLPLSARPVDVVVVTQEDDLLFELREALPRPARIRPVDSAAAAVQLIRRTNRCQVLLFDTRFLKDVRAEVELAQAEVPHAVPLLLVPPELAGQVTAGTGGLALHGALSHPIDATATRGTLESAFAEAVVRRPVQAAPPSAPTHEAGSPPVDLELPVPQPEDGKRRTGFPLVAACGVLLAGGSVVGWIIADHTAAPLAPPKAQTSPLSGKVDDLLENARQALRDRRFTAPPGNNALLYYRSALNADPANGEAIDGLQRLASVVNARFHKAMDDGHMDEAAGAIADIRLVTPDDPHLRERERQLHAKLVDQALSQGDIQRALALVQHAQQAGLATEDQLIAWRAAMAHMQGDGGGVQGIAAKVAASIGAGRLIEADGNDARTYVQQMTANAPDSPLTTQARKDLGAAYLQKAREAELVHDTLDGDRWLQEALAAGVGAAEVESVRHSGATPRPAAVTESERLAGLFRERLHDGRLTSPEEDSAAYYLGRLRMQEPGSAELSQDGRELAAQLLQRARGFATLGKGALAEADLAQARSYGATARDVGLVRDLEAERASTSKLRH